MKVQADNFSSALNGSDKLNDEVSIALTGRDVLLLDLCLGLIARHYAQKGTLSLEVQQLKDKLSKKQQALAEATRKKR